MCGGLVEIQFRWVRGFGTVRCSWVESVLVCGRVVVEDCGV